MVLSAPRSASTWVANWLTTDKTLCLHDPILEHKPEELDFLACDRMLGVSCTGLALLPDFVNAHPAKKVVLHRDMSEVDESLCSIGLTPLGISWRHALKNISGLHCYYDDVFDPIRAKPMYEYVTGLPFDAARHAQLIDMHVEPNFEKIRIVPDRARSFRERVERALA